MNKLTLKSIRDALCLENEDLFNLGYCLENIEAEDLDYSDSDNDSDKFEPDIKTRNEEKKPNMLSTLSINPIKDNSQSTMEAPHPILLPTPFSYLFVARPGGGKTTLLINMLQWYEGHFDNIYIFSPTISMDISWQQALQDKIIDIPKENFIKKYSEKKLSKLFKEIKKKNKGVKNYPEKTKVLFIFDDIINDLPRAQKTTFNSMCFNFRHYGISHITLSQSYKVIPPKMRRTSFATLLWDTDNFSERNGIIEELGGKVGLYRFARLWQEAASKKYGFLYIKNFTDDIQNKYHDGFTAPMNPFNYSNAKFDFNEIYNKKDKEEKLIEEDDEEEEDYEGDIDDDDYGLLLSLIRGKN